MRVPLVIDRRSATPLHRQIYDAWRQAVLTGRWRGGERAPSTRELSAALSVSRATVNAAYEQLTAEGYFEATHGSGTFVCRDLPQVPARPHRSTSRSPHGAAARPSLRLSAYATHLHADPPSPAVPPGTIDLSTLIPDFDAFPFTVWRRLMVRHLRQITADMFDYAGSGVGFAPLRREIAVYLARSRAVRCTPEQIIIVNGSQQALDLCARMLVDAGDEVAVENPGYPRARQLFAAQGARVCPVRVTADGLAVGDLGSATRLVYVTPSHQFPSGVSMSLARRLDLLEWARSRAAVVIEDDYDSEYRYSGAPLPAMQGLVRGAAVIYMGTFSKVMFPGLRIGYLVVPRDMVAPFTRAKVLSDRQTTGLEQAALADFLAEGHLERHIRRMRRLYKRRREVLIESLTRRFGNRVTTYGDAAGMHVLIGLRGGAAAIRATAGRVRLESAERYYATRPPTDEFILGFAAIGERTIRAGLKMLADALS
jgi:GntR family transcriptional regulator/MocR family aminotransferase